MRVLFLLLFTLVVSACGNPQARLNELQVQKQQTVNDMAESSRAPTRAFLAENPFTCDSSNLKKAESMALLTSSLLNPREHGFDTVLQSGTWILEVGDAAKSRGCKTDARKMYDAVISTYVGSGYAALRQRAQIGIDDLR